MGKKLGAIIPPIGERAIAFTCIVPGRFKATVDTTEHNGFGYHGRLVSFFVVVTSLPEPDTDIGDSRHLLKLPKRPRASYLCIGPECRRFFTRSRCLHANSSAITSARYVIAVTANLTPRRQTTRRKARANSKFREMAMKKNLIPAAIIVLATVWFALDAGVVVLTLLS